MTKSEEITSLISQKFFLNQFIYSDIYLKKDNDEKEFCDCLIEFENVYVCIQIKEKSDDSSSLPYAWYKNKILHKAKSQIKATIDYYKDDTNFIFSKSSDLQIDRSKVVIPVIVFVNNEIAYYERILESKKLDAPINVFKFEDFKIMLETIVLPYDIVRYLEFRNIFRNNNDGKLLFDNIGNDTILTKCRTEKDYSELFLVHNYYKEILKNNLSEEYIRFYNQIIYQTNEMRQYRRDDFISGLLLVDYVRANIISTKWIKFVEAAKKDCFKSPFHFDVDNRVYMFFAKPRTMSEKDFSLRLDLCLVYYKYKHQKQLAHIFIFKMEDDNNYSVSIGDINLEKDIPYEELIDQAKKFFEEK